jgi:N-acetyl-gamma-glutamyl-phosphate reductase
LLAGHPDVELVSIHADRSAGFAWGDLHPGLRHLHDGILQPLDADALAGLDVVFLALPSGVSASVAARLHGRVGTVIDLSGDLRLADAAQYRRWYGIDHPAPELLGRAVYGLPELAGDRLRNATLVASAGCYATVVQLAAAPLLVHGIVTGPVRVVATSGTTGAGRKPDTALSFSEVHGDVRPYRVGRHQHVPEIESQLARRTGEPVGVTFVPQIAPLERGIVATVLLEPTARGTAYGALEVLQRTYADAPCVRVLRDGRLPSARAVARTPFCDLAVVEDPGTGDVVVCGAIDNLMKGAASQAVQGMNAVFGLDPGAGLVGRAAMETTT